MKHQEGKAERQLWEGGKGNKRIRDLNNNNNKKGILSRMSYYNVQKLRSNF